MIIKFIQKALFALCITPSLLFSQAEISDSQLLILESHNPTIFQHAKEDFVITDDYTSRDIRHMYLQQAHNGIAIEDGYYYLHYKSLDKIFYTDQRFENVSNELFESTLNYNSIKAIQSVAIKKGYYTDKPYVLLEESKAPSSKSKFQASDIAFEPITIKLIYLKVENNFRLCWDFTIYEKFTDDKVRYIIDGETSVIYREQSLRESCAFGSNVEMTEEPFHEENMKDSQIEDAKMLPTANSYVVFDYPNQDAYNNNRTTVVAPWLNNPIASPNGWHTDGTSSYTVTKGNNVDVYSDENQSNSPTNGDADRVDGGPNLDFNFPWVYPGSPPTNYKQASLTNLFYWGNLMHDVWYNYGFDEPSGNFQDINYTNTGLSMDYVKLEGFDTEFTCNAHFYFAEEGVSPRIQMYLCNSKDGSFDNHVIAHEYAHGISNRLEGGPSSTNCQTGHESQKEGISDWIGLVMMLEPSDIPEDLFHVGNWLFNYGVDGPGIRPYPYTVDISTNPTTYNSISSLTIPHGVGSVWCTTLWDLTWALIGEEGFDPDIYNGTGGNNIVMDLVIEAMKLNPCNPGFIDSRDAILKADTLLYSNQYSCLIWNIFARRGMGYSAIQGSASSVNDNTEAFDLPPTCTCFSYFIKAKCKDKTLVLDFSGNATLNISDIDDGSYSDCTPPIYSISGPVDYDCSYVGNPTTVTLTITDPNDPNNSQSCQSIVTVIDNSPPIFDPVSSILIPLDQNCEFVVPNYLNSLALFDACGIDSSSYSQFPTPGTIFSDAQNIPFFISVSDVNGNQSSELNFTVITYNNAQPTAVCKNATVYLDNTGGYNLTFGDIDNGSTWSCATPEILVSPSYIDCFNLGTITASLTIDLGVNSSTCSCQVTVIDEIAPIMNCPTTPAYIFPPTTVDPDMLGVNITTDNCFDGILTISQSNIICGNIPEQLIVTATDNSGNTSTCAVDVIADDYESPIALCKNAVLNLDQQALLNVLPVDIDNGSTDNCQISTWSVSPNIFHCSDVGTTKTVHLTVTDFGGNTNSCSSQVTIQDNAFPNNRLVLNNLNNGAGSLRQLVFDACQNDIISFHPTLLNDTIQLTGSRIVVGNKNLTINGLGLNQFYISGNYSDMVFYINNGQQATIKNLNIINGFCPSPILGGGLDNRGMLTLQNVKFSNNTNLSGPSAISNYFSGNLILKNNVEIEEE